tara:strand:- start:8202 stop:8987 length:786 start_codon:yes stop_codon:yes gene_type:complete
VTNDANLSKTVQHLIDIEVDPAAASSSSSKFNGFIPVLVILLIAIIGGGGWIALKIRNKNLAQEALALQQAADEEESEQPEPEREDQLLMYATTESQGFGGGDSIASLAGAEYAHVGATTDALSAFVDDEIPPEEEEDTILDDLDFLKKRDGKPESSTEQQPTVSQEPPITQANVAKRSSGVVLPGNVGSSQPTTSQTTPQVSEASPPTLESKPEPTQEKVTTVKASCPACEQMFAVDMPNNIDEALVACPKCEQKIRLQL